MLFLSMVKELEEILFSSVRCIYQVSFGGEAPCCSLKWETVLNDPKRADSTLKNGEHGKRPYAPTACIPYAEVVYIACLEGVKNPPEEIPPPIKI